VSHPQTDDTKARISHGLTRYHKRKRALEIVAPRLAPYRRRKVAGSLDARLVRLALQRVGLIVDALGGPERVSPQRLELIEDFALEGLVLQREFEEYASKRDPDAARNIVSLVNSRRALLNTVGLDRVDPEVEELPAGAIEIVQPAQPGKAAQDRAGATNSADPDPLPQDAEEVSISDEDNASPAGAVHGSPVVDGDGAPGSDLPSGPAPVSTNTTNDQEN